MWYREAFCLQTHRGNTWTWQTCSGYGRDSKQHIIIHRLVCAERLGKNLAGTGGTICEHKHVQTDRELHTQPAYPAQRLASNSNMKVVYIVSTCQRNRMCCHWRFGTVDSTRSCIQGGMPLLKRLTCLPPGVWCGIYYAT